MFTWEVKPGVFDVAETTPDGWDETGNDCVDVVVGPGEEQTCTITNTQRDQQAFIIIDKTVINDNGGTASPNDFLLTVDGNPAFDGVALAVNPGAHNIGETLLSGYSAGPWGTDCNAAGSVTVALGETKTCTITNDDQQAFIIIDKTVINDNDGTAVADDFLLTVDNSSVLDGAQTPVDPGAHNIGETQLPGYTASNFGGDCNPDGSVTIALGETKTCTITNDDIVPPPPSEPTKVEVCHKNKKTLSINSDSVEDHINHGDKLGPCDAEDKVKKSKK